MSETRANKNQGLNEDVITALAEAYYRGIGVEKNYDLAYKYYKKASSMGNPLATFRLGECYEKGRGVKKDIEEAFDLYEDASDSGSISAMIKLGDYYRSGIRDFIPRDINKSDDLYVKALDALNQYYDAWDAPDVYVRIGDLIMEGKAEGSSTSDALRFYEMAVDGYYDRIDSGDASSEKLLLRAEKGVKKCHKILGIKEDPQNIHMEA